MTAPLARDPGRDALLHWFDFVCPFCYVGQHRTAILERGGLRVTELPFQIHPEIPLGGKAAGPRVGPMYERLDAEARAAGLPLNWPPRLPNTRRALACAEWARRHAPVEASSLRKSLFAAHFVDGEDLGDPTVLDRRVQTLGIDLPALHRDLNNGSADAAVVEAESLGRSAGVRGTPAWLIGGELISGLLPPEAFERLTAGRPNRGAV